MDVQCKVESLRGEELRVNGTTYKVGIDGLIKGLAAEDAAKLLRMPRSSYAPVEGAPKPPPMPPPKPPPVPKARKRQRAKPEE